MSFQTDSADDVGDLIAALESDFAARQSNFENTKLFAESIVNLFQESPLGERYEVSGEVYGMEVLRSGFIQFEIHVKVHSLHFLTLGLGLRRNDAHWILRRYSLRGEDRDLSIATAQEALSPLYELLRLESQAMTKQDLEGKG